MSAYSASRHLAVELNSYGPECGRFTQAVLARLQDAGDGPARVAIERIEADGSTAAVGEEVGRAFEWASEAR